MLNPLLIDPSVTEAEAANPETKRYWINGSDLLNIAEEALKSLDINGKALNGDGSHDSPRRVSACCAGHY